MKSEIPADIFSSPPPLCLRKNIYQIIEGSTTNYLVSIHALQFSIIKQ